MPDLIFVALTVALFAAMAATLTPLTRLLDRDSAAEQNDTDTDTDAGAAATTRRAAR